MEELLTAAEMRALEQAAIGSGAVTGLELMERAGRGAVEAVLDWRPGLAERRADGAARRALVLCGPGNNGGDGFVVARLLQARGWAAEAFLFARAPDELDRLPEDAAENARRWAALGPVSAFPPPREALAGADLVVDALFGTGLARPLEGAPAELARALADMPEAPPVAAVDMPSGVCSDSGRVLGTAFRAALTVSFHALKCGHHLAEGPEHCGRVAVADIGLARGVEGAARLVGPPGPGRLAKRAGHKYDHGHALVLAGGVAKGGAARMAARGALRIGAGLVTVGCPPAALIENAARLDAIMLRPVGDAAALDDALADPRITALCLGPGLGVGKATRDMVTSAFRPGERGEGPSRPAGTRLGVVLDADALTSFGEAPEALFGLLDGGAVLTPHEGEFARIFPDLAERLSGEATEGPAFSRIDAARAAAARAGCTVLLKGADTVIADASGRAAVSSAAYGRAAPWLATAGAGDVLAGMIAGLLARGRAPFEAAEAAAWLHAEAARRLGPGLIAEDIPEALPRLLADLGA